MIAAFVVAGSVGFNILEGPHEQLMADAKWQRHRETCLLLSTIKHRTNISDSLFATLMLELNLDAANVTGAAASDSAASLRPRICFQ